MGWWQQCIAEFEVRKQQGSRWPGIFMPAKAYCSHQEAHPVLPDLVHWFDQETLTREVEASGFTIEKIGYIDRAGIYPEGCCLDGRESVGVVAVKV